MDMSVRGEWDVSSCSNVILDGFIQSRQASNGMGRLLVVVVVR